MGPSLRTDAGRGGRSAVALGLALTLVACAAAAAPPVGQTIWLRAGANAQYVCADQSATHTPLRANRASVGAWEQFQVGDAGSGLITLRAASNLYVSADQNLPNVPLVANRTSPRDGSGSVGSRSAADRSNCSPPATAGTSRPTRASAATCRWWRTA